MDEITQILNHGESIDNDAPLTKFINKAIETCRNNTNAINGIGLTLGECFAAIFDLAISGVYADKIGNNGWVFCRNGQDEPEPLLFYPFVNACPRCSIKHEFIFTPSKKPESAVIGRSTSIILATIFQNIIKHNNGNGCRIYTLRGSGIVDAFIHEDKKIGLLEIKAAPLVTFPFSIPSEDLIYSDAEGSSSATNHQQVVVSSLSQSDISISLTNTGEQINLGYRKEHSPWPFDKLESFASSFETLEVYLKAWKDVFNRYSGNLPKANGYWLANGCGQPVPRTSSWPARRVGSGFESISDSKCSVGMDRTDDIKKGIYQVLKIGTHFKEFLEQKDYQVVTALASNMHAIRHHDDYLKEFEDIIWSIDADNRPYTIQKNDAAWTIPIEGVHNLYDGLISLTRIYARDEWLKKALSI